MKVKYVVWLPFNRSDRDMPGGWRFESTLAKPEWWNKRAAVMAKYTLPSLRHQTDQDFEVAAAVHPHVKRAHYAPVENALNAGQRSTTLLVDRSGRTTTEQALEPRLLAKRLFTEDKELTHVVMIRLDSDDAYLKHAVARVREALPVRPGAVGYFQSGYCLDVATGRVGLYDCEKGPMPFYAVVFPREAADGPDAWTDYRQAHKLFFFHHQVHRVPGAVALGKGFWLHTLNDNNTKPNRDTFNTCQHITELAADKARRVMEWVGC